MARKQYDPARQTQPAPTDDPIEVSLVYQVRPCGTCSFFWPDDPATQPYGPFPSFDFTSNTPEGGPPKDHPEAYRWLPVVTREPTFPNGEVMDGCRKAPIMTIGINPNLTAFSPGRTGTSWAYPDFSSDHGTDAFTKYAYYYRYRSVYQERFDFAAVSEYLLPEGRIVAQKAGEIVAADRPSSAPSFDLKVRYDGDTEDTVIPLQREPGQPRYVLLFDRRPPDNRFAAGDVIAARLDVPAGQTLELWQEQEAYYEQFVPTLSRFQAFLQQQGHADASLQIGEDVCQLDMVACASPHWKPDFLGNSKQSEQEIIDNCVSRNAWALKQLVQTRPAVLYLVGESSYSMFRKAFGALLQRDPPLSARPADGAFTLLHETTDPAHPCTIELHATIDGREYRHSTRLVVTPHFSYDSNFVPQIRLSRTRLDELRKAHPDCVAFLEHDERIEAQPAEGYGYDAFLLTRDVDGVWADLQAKFPDTVDELRKSAYDPHAQMASVLSELYQQGHVAYTAATKDRPGFVTRTEGSCRFCVNQHWSFPAGCPYGKTEESEPPRGFLAAVAEQLAAEGKPTQ